jgi:hypothetical protein
MIIILPFVIVINVFVNVNLDAIVNVAIVAQKIPKYMITDVTVTNVIKNVSLLKKNVSMNVLMNASMTPFATPTMIMMNVKKAKLLLLQ